MTALSLGLDLGSSGIRSAVIDAGGTVLSMARAAYPDGANDPDSWWTGALACLKAQVAALREAGLDPSDITDMAVDGTSGSMVLTDGALIPVTRALMYHDGGFEGEAAQIAQHAPDPHITRGAGSALARLLRLQSEAAPDAARHLLHQADFIAAKLMGQGGWSDHNNALKTGFDPASETWPDWFEAAGVDTALLPQVKPAGAPLFPVDPAIAAEIGVSPEIMVHAGTTDSIAAFLAAAPMEIGAAVTSIGTTLAIKILSRTRIDAPEIGLYAHKLGDGWLVGGASNSGGGVLLDHFTPEEMTALSAHIDPSQPTGLDFYPLRKPGERFPINDPNLQPRLTPRPAEDALFLQAMFEGIAGIEAKCYAEIAARGGDTPDILLTAGGGAANPVFTAIRERVLGRDIAGSETTEAAIGSARLAQSRFPAPAEERS